MEASQNQALTHHPPITFSSTIPVNSHTLKTIEATAINHTDPSSREAQPTNKEHRVVPKKKKKSTGTHCRRGPTVDSPVTNAGTRHPTPTVPLPPNPLWLYSPPLRPYAPTTYHIAVNFNANSPLPPVLYICARTCPLGSPGRQEQPPTFSSVPGEDQRSHTHTKTSEPALHLRPRRHGPSLRGEAPGRPLRVRRGRHRGVQDAWPQAPAASRPRPRAHLRQLAAGRRRPQPPQPGRAGPKIRRHLPPPDGAAQPGGGVLAAAGAGGAPHAGRGVRLPHPQRGVRHLHGGRAGHGVHRVRRPLAQDAAHHDRAFLHQQGGAAVPARLGGRGGRRRRRRARRPGGGHRGRRAPPPPAAHDVQQHVPHHVRPALREHGRPALPPPQGAQRRAQPPRAELRVQLRRLHPHPPPLPPRLPQDLQGGQGDTPQALQGLLPRGEEVSCSDPFNHLQLLHLFRLLFFCRATMPVRA